MIEFHKSRFFVKAKLHNQVSEWSALLTAVELT